MNPFTHRSAKTIEEAIEGLKACNGKARLMAGGTDLLGTLKDRNLPDSPETIINIKTISNLDYIQGDTDGLKIGALAKLADLAGSPLIKEKYKLLAEAAHAAATPQVRNMATVGGNLCQEIRCWYYRYPHSIGGRIVCFAKGGKGCNALTGENQYHSIYGAYRGTSPSCSVNCPGGVDIPSYLNRIREGDLREAARTILTINPIPSITGRVCPHFCEEGCYRGEWDESLSIRPIERFMGDYILENAREIIEPPENKTGKKVAIVGSGPAGLSAAYYLRISGHSVMVFDRMERPGGMLAYGIPEYRLPKELVKRVTDTFEYIGIEFRPNVDVGKDLTMEALRRDFDALFLATGTWRQQTIGLEGESLTRSGLEFLTHTNLGRREIPGGSVLVIGGGNVAVDVGITALRLGARAVLLACLESREEMPALKREIEEALEEGVQLMPSWGPHRVLTSHGKIIGMELVKCTLVFDPQGCFAPTYDHAVKKRVEADQIIMAVGQRTDLSFVDPHLPLKIDHGLIVVDPETQETNVPGIFAGGEVTRGPATVVEAIAAGRRAAFAMNLYLGGANAVSEKEEAIPHPLLKFDGRSLQKTTALKEAKRPVEQRTLTAEDTAGLGLNEIEMEANRCFNCGCVAASPSDMAVALLALDAKVKIVGSAGSRIVSMEDFCLLPGNPLQGDEILTEILVPTSPAGVKQTFLKFRIREPIDFAIASVASVITVEDGICKDARIVMGAVAPIPVRSSRAEKEIEGKVLDATAAEKAAAAAVADAMPLIKNAYKIEIVRTLIKRALLG